MWYTQSYHILSWPSEQAVNLDCKQLIIDTFTIGNDVDEEYAEVQDVEEGSEKQAEIPFNFVGIEEVAEELIIKMILKTKNS